MEQKSNPSKDNDQDKSGKENLSNCAQSSKDILALASVIDPVDSANMIKDIRRQNMHRMQEFHGRLDNETGSRQPVLSLMCIKVGLSLISIHHVVSLCLAVNGTVDSRSL